MTTDVSYGTGQAVTETNLVAAGATASYYVPTSGSLGSTLDADQLHADGLVLGSRRAWGLVSLVPGFAVTNYKSNLSSISSVAQAQSVINTVSNQSWTSSETAPYINYMNTGGGGEFSSSDRPFPGMPIGTDYDCFVDQCHRPRPYPQRRQLDLRRQQRRRIQLHASTGRRSPTTACAPRAIRSGRSISQPRATTTSR